eukprot:SAG31_NODE_42_length_31262_cov_46.416231_22_plen_109_part_00
MESSHPHVIDGMLKLSSAMVPIDAEGHVTVNVFKGARAWESPAHSGLSRVFPDDTFSSASAASASIAFADMLMLASKPCALLLHFALLPKLVVCACKPDRCITSVPDG